MAISQRSVVSTLLAAAVVVTLAACSPTASSGSGGSGSGAGSGSKSGSGTSAASTATFSGSESGTVTMNNCISSAGYSIYVVVKGSSDKLPGVVSKDAMDFNGSDSIYSIDKSGPLPQFSSDGKTVTLDGVKLKSVINSSNEVTFAGSITCP